MKIRNKKTGDIVEVYVHNNQKKKKKLDDGDKSITMSFESLAELNAEWEDAPEEPKDYYVINLLGKVSVEDGEYQRPGLSELGLTFETKEEAEKAVEKLKAWKILNDNGFRTINWEFDLTTIADGKIWFDVGVNTQWDAEQLLKQKPKVKEALDLLFGGEE